MSRQDKVVDRVPDDFQQELVKDIFEVVDRGESLRLVGLPGMGKSILMSSLAKRSWSRYQFVYVDLKLLTNYDLELNQTGQKGRVVVILDNFVDSKIEIMRFVLARIKANCSQNRLPFNLVFCLEQDYDSFELLGFLGDWGVCCSENVLYVPLLDWEDASWFMRLCAKEVGVGLWGDQEKEIFKWSGGYMRTIKRLVSLVAKLSEVVEEPGENIKMSFHFEQMLSALKKEEEVLKRLVFGEVVAKEDLKRLFSLGLVSRDKRELKLPLFLKYLKQKWGQGEGVELVTSSVTGGKVRVKNRLTRGEYKLIVALLSMEGIIEKTELVGQLDISNHALDQLVFRLRKKLVGSEPETEIKTVFGRGYRLVYNCL